MDKNLMEKLLKYEINILRWTDELENAFNSVGFQGDLKATSAGMYELYDLILDELGVAPDSDGFPGRDAFYDMYYHVWTSTQWEKHSNKMVKNLINDVTRMLKSSKK